MRLALLALGLATGALGCVAVGTGTTVLVKAKSVQPSTSDYFPHFTAASAAEGGQRIAVTSQRGDLLFPRPAWWRGRLWNRYRAHLERKYGTDEIEPVALALSVRDLGVLPPFTPEIQVEARQQVLKILSDATIPADERLQRVQLLQAQLLNAPQFRQSSTLRGYEVRTLCGETAGHEIYYYYPRLEIDFSAELFSPSLLDRFSHLAVVVRLDEGSWTAGAGSRVRILDFAPKGADVAEYTRGALTQTSQLQAKGTYGVTRGGKVTTTVAPTATEDTSGLSLGGEVSYTHTEAFVRELKDSLEKRTAGLVDDGRAFIVEMRAIRHLRIGGSYTFELMLEVPATPNADCEGGKLPARYRLDPIQPSVTADVTLLGVVRHVYDRGMTGFFRRVPELDNDDVYEQVVVKEDRRVPLWTFGGVPWIRPYETRPRSSFVVQVATNTPQASFVVRNRSTGALLGKGGGQEAKIVIPTEELTADLPAEIQFLHVLVPSEKGATALAPRDPTRRFLVRPNVNGLQTFTADYLSN